MQPIQFIFQISTFQKISLVHAQASCITASTQAGCKATSTQTASTCPSSSSAKVRVCPTPNFTPHHGLGVCVLDGPGCLQVAAILGRTTSFTLTFALCQAATAKACQPSTDRVSLASAEATTPWADWKAATTQVVAATGQATAAGNTP